MPIDRALVLVLVASVTLFAVARGGRPERLCATVLVLGILADRLYPVMIGERDFNHFATSRMVFDLLQFAAYLGISLFANRVWPLWLSAAQLVALTGSIAALVIPDGINLAYWALTQLPLFIQVIALFVGTFAHWRRVRRIGNYNCWSPETPKLLTHDR